MALACDGTVLPLCNWPSFRSGWHSQTLEPAIRYGRSHHFDRYQYANRYLLAIWPLIVAAVVRNTTNLARKVERSRFFAKPYDPDQVVLATSLSGTTRCVESFISSADDARSISEQQPNVSWLGIFAR